MTAFTLFVYYLLIYRTLYYLKGINFRKDYILRVLQVFPKICEKLILVKILKFSGLQNTTFAKIKFFRHNFPLFSKKIYLLKTYQLVRQWVFINNACYIFRQKLLLCYSHWVFALPYDIFWNKTYLNTFYSSLFVFQKSSTGSIFWQNLNCFEVF